MATETETATKTQADTPKPVSESFSPMLERLKAQLSGPEAEARDRKMHQEQIERDRQAHDAKARESLASLLTSVGPRYRDCTLACFEVYHGDQKAVLERCTEFAESMGENIKAGRNALFYGPPGTGKDHLLVAMLKAAARTGHTVKWFNGATLYARLRDNIADDKRESDLIIEMVAPQVLGLSDPQPAKGGLSDFQAAKLFEIIDARYRQCKPTWVTMNVPDRAEASQRIGAAVVDRLAEDALACCCNWGSYRARKA